MNLRPNIKGLFVGLFTLLFVACYANATLFMHTHVIDGEEIAHSHFYIDLDQEDHGQDQGQSSHSHDKEQAELICYLNQILCTDDICYGPDTDFTLYDYSLYSYSTLQVAYTDYLSTQYNPLRGPPSLLYTQKQHTLQLRG